MATDSHRLSILTSGEIDHLYGLPRFTEEERRLYFGLSATEREAVEAYTPALEAHFTLLLGYFKAKQQYFVYEQGSVLRDLRHVLGRHFPGMNLAFVKMPSKPTRLAQQQIILKLFHFRPVTAPPRKSWSVRRSGS
jgi:hypothetical protein